MRYTTGALLSVITAALLTGCGESSSGSGTSAGEKDIIVSTRIDNTSGFLNLGPGGQSGHIGNENGIEMDPSKGVFYYNGHVYTSGSMADDRLTKYEITDSGLNKIAEMNMGGGSIPTSYTFISDTKAYVALAGNGKVAIINPTTFEKTGEIDLASYAMGDEDNNPEPSAAVVRDGKLYMGLGQIDGFQTYKCYDMASVVIIDIATDTVDKHITDDRTCATGMISPNNGLVLDENGDIYVNNGGSYGYYGDMFKAGYLRIKDGETEFDDTYFFNITDYNLTGEIEGGKASYNYHEIYMGGGIAYTDAMIPGLTSSPPDYVNDRNFQPFKLDLYNQTMEKVDLPASSGWSSFLMDYNGEVLFGLSTADGEGLYRIGDETPYISTDGSPIWIKKID